MKKKFFVGLLAAMLLIAATIPVFSLNEPTVFTVGEAEATPGDEVALTIDVSNNCGMAGVVLTLKYDTNALSLTRYENGTVYTNDPTAGKNFVWTAGGVNTTRNGTLITLFFTVNEEAQGGDYSIGVVIRECYNVSGENVATEAIGGKISVMSTTSEITHADMVLAEDITVNYYAKVEATYANPRMRFTMNGKQTSVLGVATGNSCEYVFAFCGVAPQCMGDNIKAELLCGGEVVDTKAEYSVKQYCQNMLAKDAATLGMSEDTYGALKTLIADLLEYGACAQQYRGYKTDALVNEGVEGSRTFVELSKTDKYTEPSSREGIMITSAGVYFDSVNALYIKLLAPGLTDDTCHIKVCNETTGEEYTYYLSDCTLLDQTKGEYRLILNPITATGYDDRYTINLVAPRTADSTRLVEVHFLEYSLSSFVHSMQNKESNGKLTPMARLARATYNYGLSAGEYAAICQ